MNRSLSEKNWLFCQLMSHQSTVMRVEKAMAIHINCCNWITENSKLTVMRVEKAMAIHIFLTSNGDPYNFDK